MSNTLENAPVLHLLIELMKGGRAKIFPDLEPLEPIEKNLILRTLCDRIGVDFGPEFEPWYRWFLEDYADASYEDREKLRIVKRLVDGEKKYIERITRKRKKAD